MLTVSAWASRVGSVVSPFKAYLHRLGAEAIESLWWVPSSGTKAEFLLHWSWLLPFPIWPFKTILGLPFEEKPGMPCSPGTRIA